jgi:hypothetical protein
MADKRLDDWMKRALRAKSAREARMKKLSATQRASLDKINKRFNQLDNKRLSLQRGLGVKWNINEQGYDKCSDDCSDECSRKHKSPTPEHIKQYNAKYNAIMKEGDKLHLAADKIDKKHGYVWLRSEKPKKKHKKNIRR